MANKNLWWGYRHVSGSYHVKRYFGKLDISEARESDFSLHVTNVFEAEDRDEALKIVERLLG